MDTNIEVCRSIAIQHGLPLQFVIKEFHVFDVLAQVAEFTTKNGVALVFKGGTALSKVYLGKAQRFSEDLDFDFDGDFRDIKKLSAQIAENIRGYGITEFRKVGDTIQFYCSYDNGLGNTDNIRIDIASKKIITSQKLVAKPAFSEFTRASVSGFLVYSLEDLMAQKLNALCNLAEGKDFYDASIALPLCGKMVSAIEQMLKSENRKESAGVFVKKTIITVQRANYKKLRDLTNPFIPLVYRPKDWVEFKNDLVMKLEGLLIV